MQMSMKENEAQREEDTKEEEAEAEKARSGVEDPNYCSSGLESDNDLDLLVE